MKQTFHYHYRLDEQEIQELWNSAIFAFDANVLLNFYRYSDVTIEEFFEIIKKVQHRIWLPFHAGQEFHTNRLEVISTQAKTYSATSVEMGNLIQKFSAKDRNPFLSKRLFKDLSNVLKRVVKELDDKQKVFDGLIFDDNILENLSTLFSDRIGDGYDPDELQKIYKEGGERFATKTPPGYSDKDKPEPERYGDLVLWRQMIDKSKTDKRAILFVTDDRKEDWWLDISGKTIGPLPALREEFFRETQQQFYIYRPFQFLEFANKYLSASVNADTIEEVKVLVPLHRFRFDSPHEDILITLIVDRTSPKSDIDGFLELLRSNGYDVRRFDVNSEISRLVILVPNIPDLPRRVNKKFLSDIDTYGLKVVESNFQIDEKEGR